jgi:hypothetical protein
LFFDSDSHHEFRSTTEGLYVKPNPVANHEFRHTTEGFSSWVAHGSTEGTLFSFAP